jgi:AbrB family looped-hinge helix DNA binding protein
MGAVTVKVDASGQLVIPKDMREQLGIPEGGDLRLSVEDGELRAVTVAAEVKELRDLVRPWRREHGSAVDQLLAERRIEAALEAVEDVDREAAHSARAAIFAQLGRVGDGC